MDRPTEGEPMTPRDRKQRYNDAVRQCTLEQVAAIEAIENSASLRTAKELQARVLYLEWKLDEACTARTQHTAEGIIDYDAELQRQHA